MRRHIFLTLLLAATPLVGQPLSVRLSRSFDAMDHLILTPAAKQDVQQSGKLDPNRDYFGEVSAMLKTSADASYLCAALTQASKKPENGFLPGAKELRDRELVLCRSYPPTKGQLTEIQQWLNPAPTPRREQIVMQLQPRPGLDRLVGGIYAPSPLDPMDWVNGNTQGRDYRKDVEAAFEANPLEAATICVSATRLQANTADAQKYLPILLDVCKAFPDSKIEAAFAGRKSNDGRSWLTGLMNTFLDEAATLSTDSRRVEANRLLDTLTSTRPGQARFQAALRMIALLPDDWRGVLETLQYSSEASYGTPGAPKDTVVSWLSDFYTHRATQKDAPATRRPLRDLLFLSGHVEEAEVVGREIASQTFDNQHSVDLIHLAVIERTHGDRSRYDQLMTNCPPADLYYVQQYGKPQRPERYCEDRIAELTRGARELLGDRAPAQVSEMFMETNRVTPAPAVVTLPPAGAAPPSEDKKTADWFSGLINQRLDQAAQRSTVEREQASVELAESADCERCLDIESALTLVVYRPWHEAAAAAVIRAARTLGYSQNYDKRKHVERLVAQLNERQASSAPNADEWKRGWRAFLLFTGDYQRALELSRQIAKSADSRYATRDAVLQAILERISGNPEPYRNLMQHCPRQPEESVRRDGILEDPNEFCRANAFWQANRAALIWKKQTPAVYTEILKETIRDRGLSPTMRITAAAKLGLIDDRTAQLEWMGLLKMRDFPSDSFPVAFAELARIAERTKEWSSGIAWADRYLSTTQFSDPGMPRDGWKRLDELSDQPVLMSGEQFDVLELRFRLSIGAGDLENARRSIEYMLGTSARDGRERIILALLELGNEEVNLGKRREALRIAGFVANQPIGTFLSGKLLELRTKLGTKDGKPVDPTRESEPWDSPPRLPRRIPAPALETKVS